MAAVHSQNAQTLVAQYNLTGYVRKAELTAGVRDHDSTVLGQSAESHLLGLRHGGVLLEGLFDRSTGASYDVLSSAFGASTPRVVTLLPEGGTLGYPAALCYANENKFDDSVSIEDLVSVVGYFNAAEDGVDFGVSLHALGAETSTANGSSVDNSASSANGGVGVVHVTAASSANVTVKIQHSTDGSSWADLVTFSAVTAVGSQRSEVAAGTTVNRYLRAVWTVSAGSATFLVAFARR